MRKRLIVVVFVLVGFLLASIIKAAFKYLSGLNRDALKVLAMPQVIRFEEGSSDEANFPSRPSVSEQLARQSHEIAICGEPSSMEFAGIGCRTTVVELVERIVDARYLSGTGNLRDVMRLHFRSDLHKGEQIRLAFYELGNCLCLGACTGWLALKEIESGRGRYRREQLVLVREKARNVVEDLEFAETCRAEHDSLQIEERSWYKPDIYHDKKEVCTTAQRERATVLMEKRTKIRTISYALSSADSRGRPGCVRSLCVTTNSETKVTVVRQTLVRTNKWTESEKSYHGLKWLLGCGFTSSDKDVEESEGIICTDYVLNRTASDLGSLQTMAELKRELACLENYKTREIVLHPITQYYSELTSEDRFEDGAITYLTGGSIANLFIKTDLGYELDIMDWVWAGVDVASIAITAATWGAGGAATMAGKTVVMVTVKQGAKLAVRAMAKAGAKAATRAATRTIVCRTLRTMGREITVDGMCLVGGEFCKAIAGDDSGEINDRPGTFRELPEEWLSGNADMDNIPNASYIFPNSREQSFSTDSMGVKYWQEKVSELQSNSSACDTLLVRW